MLFAVSFLFGSDFAYCGVVGGVFCLLVFWWLLRFSEVLVVLWILFFVGVFVLVVLLFFYCFALY